MTTVFIDTSLLLSGTFRIKFCSYVFEGLLIFR